MSFKQGYLHLQNLIAEHIFRIWLSLIGLTLLSLLIAELHAPTIGATFIVCLVVLLKSRLVIDHFMGLKHAPTLTRWIINSYVYLMTFVVGLSTAYSQSLFKVDLF